MSFDSIDCALSYLRQGKMVIVVDDEDRENEGDLICAASLVTPEHINFMATHGRGLICLTLPAAQVMRLNLPLMQRDPIPRDNLKTAFTYSIDARDGIGTGISAADRAHTIRLAIHPQTREEHLSVPGHIFPLEARDGGVFTRRGHTEASLDLSRIAGLNEGGVVCEILNPDGTMMRLPQLRVFAKRHNLPLISIEELVKYRLNTEITSIREAILPPLFAELKQRIYHDALGREHVLLWKGDVKSVASPLTRIHSECLTNDVFESSRCDCGSQLKKSLDLISEAPTGILIYLRQERQFIGLTDKITAYALQDQNLDTVAAKHALGGEIDSRTYEVALRMLQDLGITKLDLLTNNLSKVKYLKQHRVSVTRVPLLPEAICSSGYQQTEARKLGQFIPFV